MIIEICDICGGRRENTDQKRMYFLYVKRLIDFSRIKIDGVNHVCEKCGERLLKIQDSKTFSDEIKNRLALEKIKE